MGINEIINVGAIIKDSRQKKGYTQKEMADKLKIPKSTYSNYENGHREPNGEMIKKIASILEMNPRELFNLPNSNEQTLNTVSDFFNNSLMKEIFKDPITGETRNDYYSLISLWQHLINVKPKKLDQIEKDMLAIGQRYIECFKILLIILGKNEISNLNDFMLSEILLSKQFDSMLEYIYYLAINNKLEQFDELARRNKEGE